MKTIVFKILLLILIPEWLLSQVGKDVIFQSDNLSGFNNDTLIVSNSLVEKRFLWNDGNLISIDFYRTDLRQKITSNKFLPDLKVMGADAELKNGEFEMIDFPGNNMTPPHKQIIVKISNDQLEIKRVFRLYPNCTAIACDYYLKLKHAMTGTERNTDTIVIEESLSSIRPHWELKASSFEDKTDINNNLVRTESFLPFVREKKVSANILMAQNTLSDIGFFILKESPSGYSQSMYPGYDFRIKTTSSGNLNICISLATILRSELSEKKWTRVYSLVSGISSSDDLAILTDLKAYKRNLRIHKAGRDNMILMNTWGDRGQDGKISESFILEELEAGKKLGITHLQIDDGWQTGKSGNSVVKGGSLNNIWSKEDYWKIDINKFPNEFNSIMEKANKYGIQIALWFNPSNDNSFENWRFDAGVLIDLYKTYGITTFKIDGVNIPDLTAEENFRAFLDTIMVETNYNAVINLDVTGQAARPGYHWFNEYGNIFLENRYTDWGNYYPHWTLRNLWMLSKFIPSRSLQIEFLNNWRNADKYISDDPLAPSNIPFEYLFATTMAAQPLAWFEGTGLPEMASNISELVQSYKNVMHEFHKGIVYPLGEEPSGASWTGFQSVLNKESGYVLIYREFTEREKCHVKINLPINAKIEFSHVMGNGISFNSTVNNDNEINFSLPQKWNFAMFKYRIVE